MFGLGKNKKNETVMDETLVDHSKKQIVGISVLFIVLLVFIGAEIYTSIVLSSQSTMLTKGKVASDKSQKILIELGKIGKEANQKQYEYMKSLEKIMSPAQFQNFKNSISGVASKHKVAVISLNEGKPVPINEYIMLLINFETVSNYMAYVNFKKELANTPFKINFDTETITRETPTSANIKVKGIISAMVFEDKEKLFKDKAKFYEKMKIAEAKKLEREAKRKALKK